MIRRAASRTCGSSATCSATPITGARATPSSRSPATSNAWGRDGDRALIALDDFHEVGAAWFRLYSEAEPGFGFVDAETPELTIGVVPSRRGKGIGSGLLDALLDRARKDGFRQISLSVEKTNPAVNLYESRGFRAVSGDGDVLMVAQLQQE